ncbi:MAG: hypothetical protein WAL84_07545 [Candidatus Dormiibacterota bacterium]
MLCSACGRPIAYVRCRGTLRQWAAREALGPSGDFWIDPLWECQLAGVGAFDPKSMRPIGAIPVPIDREAGARITMHCTRGCGASPSHHVPAILAAAQLCLEAGRFGFRLPN